MQYSCHRKYSHSNAEFKYFQKECCCRSLCVTHSAMINPAPSKLHLSRHSFGPPSLSKVTVGARSWRCSCVSVCMCCGCENICKCVARLSNPGTAWNPSHADKRGREVVSTTQALAAGEVTFIKSCQRLEIKTTIFNPACICVCACICMRVFAWAWDGTPRRYGGRNIIYCAASSRESEGIQLFFFFVTVFFLPLFIQSCLTEHTPANPRAVLIQSNIFVAGEKHSYVVATKQI